jgi:hypothetical protein
MVGIKTSLNVVKMNELEKSALARPKLRESPRVYPGRGKRSTLGATQ